MCIYMFDRGSRYLVMCWKFLMVPFMLMQVRRKKRLMC